MKTHSSRRKDGFTLVELLVVIAIIAVLAGAGFAAGNAAIQKAKKVTALASATALESAISNFYTEYATLPADPIPTGSLNSTTNGVAVIKALLGSSDSASLTTNPRAIKFLSVKEGKAKGTTGGMNGLIYSGTGTAQTVRGLFDPWGGAYLFVMDDNYDEVVTPSYTPSVTLNGRRAAVWTLGADGVKGSGGAATDDVKTW